MVMILGTCLVLTVELLIGNMSRQICVKDSAEGQSIIPAAAKVGNVDILCNKQTRQTSYKPPGLYQKKQKM